jgi:hypothetical protein
VLVTRMPLSISRAADGDPVWAVSAGIVAWLVDP